MKNYCVQKCVFANSSEFTLLLFYKNSDGSTNTNTHDTFGGVPVPLVASLDVEDTYSYIEELGNDTDELIKWSIAQEDSIDEEFMKTFCIETHSKLSENHGLSFDEVSVDAVEVEVFQSVLQFRHELYKPMKVSVIKYSLYEPIPPDTTRMYRYITGGDESSCVFYITPSESLEKSGFVLGDSVCESILFQEIDPEKVFIQQLGTGSSDMPPHIEDKFVEELGNDPVQLVNWSAVQLHRNDEQFLKVNCIETQKTLFENFGLSFSAKVNSIGVKVFESVLRFRKKKYEPMNVTVVKYEVIGPIRPGSEQTYHYLTGGDKSPCLFYLKPCQSEEDDFYLDDWVCGSELFRRSDEKNKSCSVSR